MIKLRSTTPELDDVQREAVAWVQRLVSGQATAEDAASFQRWRMASPRHARAFAEASRAWGDVGAAGRDLQGGATAGETLVRLRRQAVTRRAFVGGGLATAAVVTYGVVNPPLDLWPSLSQMSADYRTATGEQRDITLAGDVTVRMNTQTSLALRVADGRMDRVELISGEASFALPAGSPRELTVLAGDGRVQATKAAFEIRHLGRGTASAVYVTCFNGGVDIIHHGGGVALGPGQQLRYDADSMGKVAAIDPDSASNWSRGLVVFRATPMSEAIDEINRYRPGRIVLLNAELARKRITGRFRIDQMDSILTRLEQAVDARVRTLPGGLALLS